MSICGGIQPSILHSALGTEHRESGLAARLLLACPPRKPKRWSEAELDVRNKDRIERLFRKLSELEANHDDEGNRRPVELGLTPDAKAAFQDFYNRHNDEQVQSERADLACGMEQNSKSMPLGWP